MKILTLTILVIVVVIILYILLSSKTESIRCTSAIRKPQKNNYVQPEIFVQSPMSSQKASITFRTPSHLASAKTKYIPKEIFAPKGKFTHPFTGELCDNYGDTLAQSSFKPSHSNFQFDHHHNSHHDEDCCGRLEEDYLDRIESNLTSLVDTGVIKFGFASAKTKKQTHLFLAGEGKPGVPFKKTDFIRLASESKIVGSVGFLKLVDQGILTGFEPLSTFFPAFANTKVIQQFDPTPLFAPVIIPAGSLSFNNAGNLAEMTVAYTGGGLAIGDWVSIEYGNVGLNGLLPVGASVPPSVNGVPGYTAYNIHQITALSAGVSFKVVLPTASVGTGSGFGAIVIIQKVDSATKRSIATAVGSLTPIRTFLSTAYYKEVALRSAILIHHVLTHTYGLCYYASPLIHSTFGFAENIPLRNIQAGILAEKNIIPARSTYLNPLITNIQQWINAVASVPLLFQPGDKWAYGPCLSILGGIIEVVKGVTVEQYMKDEVFTPLGMNDTGFHINPSDTGRINRFTNFYYNFGAPLGLQTYDAFSAAPFLFPSSYTNALRDSYYDGSQISLIDGGMYSTVEDYLKFLAIFVHGGKGSNGARIISKSMLLNISRNHIGQNNVKNLLDYFPTTSGPLGAPPIKWAKWGLGSAVTTGADLYLARGMTINSISKRSMAWAGAFGTSWTADIAGGLVTHVGGNTIGTESVTEVQRYQAKLVNLYHAAFPCPKANDQDVNGESDYL